jgi:hypothetical protein
MEKSRDTITATRQSQTGSRGCEGHATQHPNVCDIDRLSGDVNLLNLTSFGDGNRSTEASGNRSPDFYRFRVRPRRFRPGDARRRRG